MTEIRELKENDIAATFKLCNYITKNIYPYKEITDISLMRKILNIGNEKFDETKILGCFINGHLDGIIKFGKIKYAIEGLDSGLINAGDSVILWLLFYNKNTGENLMEFALKELNLPVFAFPEFSSFSFLTPFSTGMLPVSLKEINNLFEENGFIIPRTKDWGLQERYCMHIQIPDKFPIYNIDKNIQVIREEHGQKNSTIKLLNNENEEIGKCCIYSAKLHDKIIQKCVIITWLWVKENFRNCSFGRYLICEQLEWTKKNGAKESILTTHTEQSAHYLYTKIGYKIIDILRTYCLV